MRMIAEMDVLKHNNLNCPPQREKNGICAFFVSRLTVVLCKWTGISMLWKEQSWGWREQVKISLWIISPPGPCHCSRPHTWQRQKERILLFWPKPVLPVYRLKRGKRGGIFWWKAGPLWQPSSCVPAEKAPQAEAAAVPTTCRALSPSSLPSRSALFLCLSLSSAQWLSSPASIQAEASWNTLQKGRIQKEKWLISWVGE